MTKFDRSPPAFQEFASDMLANINFRSMSLAERGMLYTIRLELWVNGSLPDNTERLARVLGLTSSEVAATLPALRPFIETRDGKIVSPELESYREHLAERRRRQSEGGKKAADVTNTKRKDRKPASGDSAGTPSSTPSSTSSGNPSSSGRVLSREEKSRAEPACRDMDSTRDEWLDSYNRAEYARASNGV